MATLPHDTRHAPEDTESGLPAPQPVEPDDGSPPPVDDDHDGAPDPQS